MSVTIRRARPGDETSIAEFAIKLFEQHIAYEPKRFSIFATVEGAERFYRSRFDTAESAVMVATLGERVIGFAYVEKDELNYAALLENAAWLHDIYVDDTSRHSGAGRGLLEASIEVARKLGASKLMLSVPARNTAAKKFFEEAGFVTTMHEMMLAVDG